MTTTIREKLIVNNNARKCDHCGKAIYTDQEHFIVSGRGAMYFHKDMTDCANTNPTPHLHADRDNK